MVARTAWGRMQGVFVSTSLRCGFPSFEVQSEIDGPIKRRNSPAIHNFPRAPVASRRAAQAAPARAPGAQRAFGTRLEAARARSGVLLHLVVMPP